MPKTAALVDELRNTFGVEQINAAMRDGKVGRGGFYAAEIGPDGVMREYGTPLDGKRRVVVDGRIEVKH